MNTQKRKLQIAELAIYATLMVVLWVLSGCATAKPYVDAKIVVQSNHGSDWMLRPDRPWIHGQNNPRLHVAVGLAFPNQYDLFIESGTDQLKFVHIGTAKTLGTYKPGRVNIFGQVDLRYQVDKWSSWWLSTDRNDWQGHNPFIHGRVGLQWKHKIKCPVWATGKSLFQGEPFESESGNPDLYWTHFECGKKWGGY